MDTIIDAVGTVLNRPYCEWTFGDSLALLFGIGIGIVLLRVTVGTARWLIYRWNRG